MRKRVRHVALLQIVLLLFLAGSGSAAVTINETFMNATAPGWLLLGTAALTGGGIDPAGAGWLRLTSNSNGQAGSAIYNTAFSSDDGITVSFTYATYGGTGADGFTFYLIDGDTVSPTVGASGGSLGYSFGGVNPGVTNGFVGIGFDEYGNFSDPGSGTCNPSCPGRMPNSITIRGSGSLTTGFNFLTRAGATIETGSRAGAIPVTITVINNKITVVHNGVTVIDQFDLSTAIGQGSTPRTFKMGFSGSTGGSTNFHEIRGLSVVSIKTSTTTALATAVNPSTVGQMVTLTATVSPSAATGTVTFMDGSTTLGTAAVNGGIATFATAALAAGTHPITAIYSGDPNYGISSSPVVDQVVAAAPAEPVPTMNEWGILLFILLAGMGSVYYLRRLGRAK
ncbi:MAG: Ig-like domain repeat protein [Nitrospiraceae bacterium]|nr:Ig-like domain repeat protein [Nitrospiraceae bacterium]